VAQREVLQQPASKQEAKGEEVPADKEVVVS
jgi:hypothetical protein